MNLVIEVNIMVSLSVLILIEVFLFCFAYYFSEHDIMSPSCMMCIMFIISTTFALLNVNNWKVNFSFNTTALIGSGLLVYVLAEIFFRYVFCGQLHGKLYVQNEYDNSELIIKPIILDAMIAFNVVVVFLYLKSIISIVGGNMTNLNSYFHAYRVMGINSMQYQGTSITNGSINFLLRFVVASGYLAAFIGMRNMVTKNAKRSVQLRYAIIVILSLMPSLMTGGRTGILRMFAALLIYYYICWHQINGWDKNLSMKYIRIGLFSFFIIAPAFYFSLEMLGRATNRTIIDYISDYLASSICLLDQYLKSPVPCVSWGEESLVGVKKLLSSLGFGELSTKYNLEFRHLGIGKSNVYTFFRRPLHDFGYGGMYVFVVLVAFFFAWMYYKKIKYKSYQKSAGWTIAYGYFYYWIMCSSIVQYSANMISLGAVIQIGIAVIGYKLFVRVGKSKRRINFQKVRNR